MGWVRSLGFWGLIMGSSSCLSSYPRQHWLSTGYWTTLLLGTT
ncbi:hypothetical protein VULLAG_LOCUS3937 [Vulpes lagopus]